MEEILALIIQFVLEVVIQSFFYLPFDVSLYKNKKTDAQEGAGWFVLYLILGGALGGISLLILPHALLPNSGWRIANLLLAPLAAGTMAWAISDLRRQRGAIISPRNQFCHGFAFALAFAAVRLAYTAR